MYLTDYYQYKSGVVLVGKKELNDFIKAVTIGKKVALEIKAEDKEKNFFDAGQAVTIYLAGVNGNSYSVSLDKNSPEDNLKNILIDETIDKYGFDLKNQSLILCNFNLDLKAVKFDLQIAAHLLDFNLEKVSLEKVFSEAEILEKKLKKELLISLFQDVEMPLIEVLASMEKKGVKLKKEILERLSEEMEGQKKTLREEIYKIAGEEFNIDSPKQLGLVLFGKLGLPPVKKKKTGFSTDGEVLEVLAKIHILPKKILEYREISKLKSTYIDVLPELISSRDGRLHTCYNQTVTATGRLSSSNPNLQNIPIRSDWGKRLREAFVSPDKYFLLGADYSQIELRLLAHFCKDALLCESFKNDEDIHTQTAQEIFEVKEGNINEDLRRMAKTINFGIIYGMSAYGLSRSLQIEVNQAQDFIERYFKKYQGVKQYINRVIEEAKNKGYVTTMFGRKRYIPEIKSFIRSKKEFAYRIAINTPIQGTAAEIIKLAMIGIYRELKKNGLKTEMILQVHDELILEVHKDEISLVKEIVKKEMESVVNISVPLKVKLSLGRSWAEI